MAPSREIWTFNDWLIAGGLGMYVIEAGAAIALPLHVLNAFRPGGRIRRAALVATAAVVALGLAIWWWSLHGMEATIRSLPDEAQSRIREEAHVEVRGVVETLVVLVALSAIALLASAISARVFRRDEGQFQPRREPWPFFGFVLYALAGIFLLAQGAFQWAYAWGVPRSRVAVPLLGGLLALVLGTVLVVAGALLRRVKRPIGPVG